MRFPDKTDRIIQLAAEEHFCPHCNEKLTCVNTPPFHVGDGLGWGTDVFFVCLNDDCELFVNCWEKFEEQYGHSASCRYMLLPGESTGEAMMVGSKDAFKGLEVDVESIKKQNVRHAKEKEALAQSLEIIKVWFRDLIICRYDAGKIINRDVADKIKNASQKNNLPDLLSKVDAVQKTQNRLAANTNLRACQVYEQTFHGQP